MKKENKKIAIVHFGFLLLVLMAGFYIYNRYGIAATVNGKSVSRIEYIKSMEKATGRQLLDRMIDETLILEEANKKGVKIEQKVIDTEVASIEEKIKAQGITLEEALKAEGMTRGDLDKQILIQKTAEILANPKTEVTQAEIDSYLAKNKDLMPKGTTKEVLQSTAKNQILSQLKNEAMTTWMNNLRTSAKIIYK